MAESLEDKVIIITGASSGIGAALVRVFSQKGARVVLGARRLKKLREVAEGCQTETLCVQGDITRAGDRQSLVTATLERWGRIDILVNNAGLGMYRNLETGDEKDIRNLFEVNVFALIFLTRMVLPVMKRQRCGMIINIASIGGLVGHSDKVTAYLATKHAVVGFTRGLIRDLQGSGVKAKVVCPQLTDTEFYEVSIGAQKLAGMIDQLQGRMDTPDQVAKGIAEQIFSDRIFIFPTEKSEKAYHRFRDL
ncbi:MAG: putative oxidoreductase [Chloroflexi bacterium]|nr:putative oxidoreductase [Chloroflexota bacterium]